MCLTITGVTPLNIMGSPAEATSSGASGNIDCISAGIQSQVAAPGGACTTGGANAWVYNVQYQGFSGTNAIDGWTVYFIVN